VGYNYTQDRRCKRLESAVVYAQPRTDQERFGQFDSRAEFTVANHIDALVMPAWGQQTANEAHVGYLYPAGRRQGAVVQITVAGRFLRSAAFH